MEGIFKAFSGVPALHHVRLEVRKGEVHALMGENGAGKSTLMRILSGIVQKDQGNIFLDGGPVEIKSPKEALDLGISHDSSGIKSGARHDCGRKYLSG